jgi:hypothetical protein
LEFLQRHTAYELIPESSKVGVLDTAIPVRLAFHALFEQGVHAAPLWHGPARAFVGVISPGDFIALLCRLQSVAGAPPTLRAGETHDSALAERLRAALRDNMRKSSFVANLKKQFEELDEDDDGVDGGRSFASATASTSAT